MKSTQSKRNKPLVIYSKRTGRLANRLTAFANCIAFCEEHGFRARGIAFHSFAHLFEKTAADLLCTYPPREKPGPFSKSITISHWVRSSRLLVHLSQIAQKLTQRKIFKPFGFSTLIDEETESFLNLAEPRFLEVARRSRIVFYHGWRFRDPKALKKHHLKIREYFKPTLEIGKNVSSLSKELRTKGDLVIGVHMRQGDYRHWKNGQYFYEVGQFVAWMKSITELFPDRRIVWLICSDETRNKSEFKDLNVVISSAPPVVDLFTLATCDYLLGPPSTFSQWASYYGQVPLCVMGDNQCKANREDFKISYLEKIP